MKPANGRSFTNEEMKIVTKEVALTRESRSEELQASLLEHKRLRLLLDEIEFRLTEEFGVIRNGANAWVDRMRIDGHYTPTSRGDSYTGPGSTRKSLVSRFRYLFTTDPDLPSPTAKELWKLPRAWRPLEYFTLARFY